MFLTTTSCFYLILNIYYVVNIYRPKTWSDFFWLCFLGKVMKKNHPPKNFPNRAGGAILHPWLLSLKRKKYAILLKSKFLESLLNVCSFKRGNIFCVCCHNEFLCSLKNANPIGKCKFQKIYDWTKHFVCQKLSTCWPRWTLWSLDGIDCLWQNDLGEISLNQKGMS